MVTSTGSYAAINPQIVDPYQVENQLATHVSDASNPSALPLLAMYMSQRKLAGDYAGIDLQEQHQQARNQLAAQIAKNAAEAISSGAQHNVLDVMATNPATAGYFANSDRDVLANRAALGTRSLVAGILKDVGAGAYSARQAGFETSPQAMTGMTGLPFDAVDPLTLGAARIKAAASGGSGGLSFSAGNTNTDTGDSWSVRGRDPNAVAAGRRAFDNAISGSGRGQMPVAATDTSGNSGSGSTSAQPTGSGKAGGYATPPKQVPQGDINAANQRMNAWSRSSSETDKRAYQEVQRNSPGGQPQIGHDAKGAAFLVGKKPDGSYSYYLIRPPGAQ